MYAWGEPCTLQHNGRVDGIGSNAPCPYAHHQMEGPNPLAVGESVAKYPALDW